MIKHHVKNFATTLTLLFLMTFIPNLFAQQDQARKWVYQGYVTGDESDWDKGISMYQSAMKTSTGNKKDEITLELCIALYGKIGYYLSKENESAAEKLIDETEGYLKALLEENEEMAVAHAVLGSVYAMKIGISPSKALILGPRSADHLEKATELDPKSGVSWCELGNMRYHAPRLFGGSMSEAEDCFSKAASLFEQNQDTRRWHYLHALVWLGKSYEEQDEWKKAVETYEKTLKHEPNLEWVKDELLPNARRKLKG